MKDVFQAPVVSLAQLSSFIIVIASLCPGAIAAGRKQLKGGIVSSKIVLPFLATAPRVTCRVAARQKKEVGERARRPSAGTLLSFAKRNVGECVFGFSPQVCGPVVGHAQ